MWISGKTRAPVLEGSQSQKIKRVGKLGPFCTLYAVGGRHAGR